MSLWARHYNSTTELMLAPCTEFVIQQEQKETLNRNAVGAHSYIHKSIAAYMAPILETLCIASMLVVFEVSLY